MTIYATNAGIATYSTSSGIATYATIAGIATYATDAGIATSVIGGIGSITQLQVTGISTFTNGPVLIGSGTSTGTTSQPLQVTGGAYVSGSVGIGTTNPTANLQVGVGTAGSAPLKLTAGTNLTTAQAGAIEYDGKVFYSTPNAASGRGLSPSTLLYRAGSTGIAGSRVTTAQATFGAGLTVVASTVYQFEMVLESYKSTGAGSYQWGYLFGGTASLTNFGSTFAISRNIASPSMTFPTNASCFQGIQTSTTVYYPYGSDSNTAAIFHLVVKGSFAVTSGGGGTFIPQYQLSADPGGAFTTQAGSYITVTPIGIGTGTGNTSIGAWA